MTSIRFTCFPRTEPPPQYSIKVVDVFKQRESQIATAEKATGLESNEVLELLAEGLIKLGFAVESSKKRVGRIDRPVFFGENGIPDLRYQIDAFHDAWSCGLEVEAGRALMGNAVYRDLIQAMVMVQVSHLCLAVPNRYRFQSKGRTKHSDDYDSAVAVASALYGHSRIVMPYGLTVIGY